MDFDECYHLTTGDVEILLDVAHGFSYAEISKKRRRSYHTIKNRVSQMRHKMDMVGAPMSALVVKAHQLKIITIPQQRRPPPVIVTERRGESLRSLRGL
jgi:DNA-binding NarL/FixJ family response regulator